MDRPFARWVSVVELRRIAAGLRNRGIRLSVRDLAPEGQVQAGNLVERMIRLGGLSVAEARAVVEEAMDR